MSSDSGALPPPAATGSMDDGGRQMGTFRLFSYFLPETSILRRFRFQLVVFSRFCSEAGQEGVFYAALVQVSRDGSPLQASMIGVAKMLPGAVLGLFGGAVADALPRRVALALGYGIQAGACIVLPFVFGTDFGAMLLLVLGVSTLNQLIGPTEKAVIPLVSSRKQISTAASMLSLADSVATGFGTAIMAPILLLAFGAKAVFAVCAVFLGIAAFRILALPIQQDVTVRAALRRLNLTSLDLGFRKALGWLLGWPAIVTMLMVGMIVSIMNNIQSTLGPSYVEEVLNADPAKSVYVFAPAGIGTVIALAVTPKFLDKTGERWAAAMAVLIMSVALFMMAFIARLAPILAPISPMNLLRLVGIELSDEILAAGFVSMFTGFSVSMSSLAVQTYLNRRVPLIHQGRVFGLQSVFVNAAALIPMIIVGWLATQTSVKAVFFFVPWVVLAGLYGLLILASRWAGIEPMSRSQVVDSFWHEPENTGEPPLEPAGATGESPASSATQ